MSLIKELSPADRMSKRLRFHPIRVITYLVIAGISSAFLTLVFCYFVTTAGSVSNHFTLPQIFHANTAIILFSSYSAWQMRQANLRNDHAAYKTALLMTSLLGIAFTTFQIIGWLELRAKGVSFIHNISGTYLYLISALHLVHLLVGVGFLLWFLVKAYIIDTDAYKSLIFDTDPVSKLEIEMLGVYWHFVDGLWIFLYLSFMVTIYLVPGSWDGWYTRP